MAFHQCTVKGLSKEIRIKETRKGIRGRREYVVGSVVRDPCCTITQEFSQPTGFTSVAVAYAVPASFVEAP